MDIFDLVGSVELADVSCIQFSGKRRTKSGSALPEAGAEGEPEVSLDVNPVLWGSRLETWFRMTVDTPDARLRAAFATIYERESDEEIPLTVQREFIERVAIMAVVPYLREAVHHAATRLQVPAPILPILRQGQFSLTEPGDASTDTASTD